MNRSEAKNICNNYISIFESLNTHIFLYTRCYKFFIDGNMNILAAALLLLPILAFAAYPLIGGRVATLNEGKGIFQIAIQDKDDEDYGFCTATKIGKNVLLTAAHCFNHNKLPETIGFSTLITNEDFDYDGAYVEKIVIPENYASQEDELYSPDIALVFLKDTPQFDLIEVLEMDLNVVQDDVHVEYWGYGCQESANKVDNYSPVKKKGTNITLNKEVLRGQFGIMSEMVHKDIENIYSSLILTPGLGIIKYASSLCFGDSGGPILYDNKVVGINVSFLSKDMKRDGTGVRSFY